MTAARLTFPLVPRGRVVGLSFGALRSFHRGAGTDVAGSRPYVPGDDMDAIDWPASARLSTARGGDEFLVRERLAEEAPRVMIICDRRPEMSYFAPPLPWLDKPRAMRTAVELILASAGAAGGYVGYLDFADGDAHWRPPKGERKLIELRDERLQSSEFGGPPDWLERSVAHLAEYPRAVTAGTFVFVLSDFLSPPLGRPLARRRRAPLGPRADRDPGSDLGAELPGRRRDRRPVPGSPLRPGRRGATACEGCESAPSRERRAAAHACSHRSRRSTSTRCSCRPTTPPTSSPRSSPGRSAGERGGLCARDDRTEKPPVALAAIGILAVVGVLAALLLTGRTASASNGLSSARPVRATASLLPAAALFGDTVTARVQLVTDTSFVQPDSLHIRGSFGPYRQVSRPVLERRRVGSTEELVWTARLRCLGSPCVPKKNGKRVTFAPASVSYSIGQGSDASRALSVAWPSLLVYSRVDQVEVAARDPRSEPPWKGDYRSLPAVSYRASPGLVAAALYGAGGLLLAGAAALLIPLVRRQPEEVVEEEEEPEPLVWLTPLEQALALLEREPRGEGEVEPRRQALELVSEVLGERDERDLERAARRLAWSEAPPPPEATRELARKVRDLLADERRRSGEEEAPQCGGLGACAHGFDGPPWPIPTCALSGVRWPSRGSCGSFSRSRSRRSWPVRSWRRHTPAAVARRSFRRRRGTSS